MNGSLLFVEEVRDGNRKDVCEVVDIWRICFEEVVVEFDDKLLDILLGLGFGELYINVGDIFLLFVLILLLFVNNW